MYVDILYVPREEVIKVVERHDDGTRTLVNYEPDYHFYVNDKHGKYKSIYGDSLSKINPRNFSDHRSQRRKKKMQGTWESDMKQDTRCLEANYKHAGVPKLQTAFFDIETDFDPINGYSPASVADNKILSFSIYLQWINRMVCISLPPPTMTFEEAEAIAEEVGDTIIVDCEKEMIDMFMILIEDADILSGWNSDFYDIPYIVNRIKNIYDNSDEVLKKLCLWDMVPEAKEVDRFGKTEEVFDLFGRVHLDYMKLYKNFSYEEKRSYSLNSIAESELGDKKVEYDHSLDHLYKHDFKLFLEYNIKDTKLLDDLDKLLQYIDLANDMAHDNCIKIPAVLGAVGMTEQAVVMEAHDMGYKVPDKDIPEDDDIRHKAAGGWVSQPVKGLHKWLSSTDLNSLYPSVIRALNMSNETIIGQIRTDETLNEIITLMDSCTSESKRKSAFAEWWNDRFCTLEMQRFFDGDETHILYLDMVDGTTLELTGAKLRHVMFNCGNQWCISANGTIFDTSKRGIMPSLLTRWYDERKVLKKKMNMYGQLEINEKNEYPIRIPDSLFSTSDVNADCDKANPYSLDVCFNTGTMNELIEEGDRDKVVTYMNLHDLTAHNGVVVHSDQDRLKDIVGYWDKKQLVKKILLNSAYGGLLNKAHRFFDQRIGQSTTLTGRSITKHMTAKTNEIITGEYDHNGVTTIYNDTDSCYFSAYPVLKKEFDEWPVEKIIQFYDVVGESVNDTFIQFMEDTFNVPPKYGEVIAAAREVVAKSGIYIKKKRYAALVIDDEGTRKDINGKSGKVKVTGLDLRRSDTVPIVQDFLMNILTSILEGESENDMIPRIVEFKKGLLDLDPWEWGRPSSANKLSVYLHKVNAERMKQEMGLGKTKGFTVPGHVTGALNWNEILEHNNDLETTKIIDGAKVMSLPLIQTPNNHYDRISYPVDESRLPEWFTSLPFDIDSMMAASLDKKVSNLVDVLNWDLSRIDLDNELYEEIYEFDDDDC